MVDSSSTRFPARRHNRRDASYAVFDVVCVCLVPAVGIEAEDEKVSRLLDNLKDKDLDEVMAAGLSKLASVPSGGAVAAGGGAAAAAGGGDAPAEDKKEPSEPEEESDEVRLEKTLTGRGVTLSMYGGHKRNMRQQSYLANCIGGHRLLSYLERGRVAGRVALCAVELVILDAAATFQCKNLLTCVVLEMGFLFQQRLY